MPTYEVRVPVFVTVEAENEDAAKQLALNIIDESEIEDYALISLAYSPDDVAVVMLAGEDD